MSDMASDILTAPAPSTTLPDPVRAVIFDMDGTLVDSQGATEGTIKNETAEAIADITSSGETLRANHLKILSDGLILRSQATLWRSRMAEMDDADRATMTALLARLS